MTESEKYVYNCYLETVRKLNNKPFRYRKDFETFEESEDYFFVKKLDMFFKKFPDVIIKDFLEAPFFVYDEKWFDIKFYITPRALKAYTTYQTTFIHNNPDDPQTLQKVKDSFEFIFKFCRTKGIPLDQYTSFIDSNDSIHSFMHHIKQRKICFYPLFLYSGVDIILTNYDEETKRFIFGNFLDNIQYYRTKYYNSSRLRTMSQAIFTKLKSL